ncbi:unnamed protein product [Calypogeia fissa]
MGLDSSGRPAANRPKPTSNSEYLNAARQSVFEILEKSKATSLAIDKSSDKLRGITDRLPALEAAVRPLQSQSRLMKELIEKVDRAIEPAETALKTFDILRTQEKIIKGDPLSDMPMYLASLSQIEEVVAYLPRNCMSALEFMADAKDYLARSNLADKYRLYRLTERLASVKEDINSNSRGGWDMGLVKIALGKLDGVFQTVLLDKSEAISLPEAVDRPEDPSEAQAPPPLPILLPPPIVLELQTIVERLQVHNWTDNILECFAEVRLTIIRQSLRSLKPEYLQFSTSEKVDKLDWSDLEGMIQLWTQHIEVACTILFKSERRLCARVFEKLEKERWIRCWGKIASGGFGPFLSFGEGVVDSQTAPEKLFKLLDMYDTMENLLPHVFEIFEGPDAGCGEVKVRSRELLKGIAHRASETVWELCRFVEEGKGDAPSDGGRSRLCSYVVNYVKYLVSEFYGPIMTKIVRTEKSWQDKDPREDSPDKWLSLVVACVMQSLEKHVVKQSKSYNDPALANIFMLNNFWYMMTRAKDSDIGPLLGETWMKDTKIKVQQHTNAYQRESWSKPLSYLSRDSSSVSSSGKGAVRDLARQRLKNFNMDFEENCRKHSTWVISEQDLKEGIRLAVTQAVVPAYRSYVQAYSGVLEQAGNVGKYMKFSPEEVEAMLEDLFEVRSPEGRVHNALTGNSQLSSNGIMQSV